MVFEWSQLLQELDITPVTVDRYISHLHKPKVKLNLHVQNISHRQRDQLFLALLDHDGVLISDFLLS